MIVMCEYAPGRSEAFLRWLPELHVLRRYAGERIPDSFDGLILGGGPTSASAVDRWRFPFLAEDFTLVQELARAGDAAPQLVGVCLGAQLICVALGGAVEAGDLVRGWNRIRPRTAHAVFSTPDPVQFEFHESHIVRLPDRAVLLADSDVDAVEAFAVGSRILATGYHPEVVQEDLDRIRSIAHVDIAPDDDRFADPGPAAWYASSAFFRAAFGTSVP